MSRRDMSTVFRKLIDNTNLRHKSWLGGAENRKSETLRDILRHGSCKFFKKRSLRMARFRGTARPLRAARGMASWPCRGRQDSLVLEALAGELDEDVLERRLAEGDGVDQAGSGFDELGDELVGLAALEAKG